MKKLQFDIFGDAVNMASRMESHGLPGRIQVSEATRDLLRARGVFHCEDRGSVPIKGKGDARCYWLYKSRAHADARKAEELGANAAKKRGRRATLTLADAKQFYEQATAAAAAGAAAGAAAAGGGSTPNPIAFEQLAAARDGASPTSSISRSSSKGSLSLQDDGGLAVGEDEVHLAF